MARLNVYVVIYDRCSGELKIFPVWLLYFPDLFRRSQYNDLINHQPRDCLLSCLFRRRSKKTSKLRVTGLCEGNLPMTGEWWIPRTKGQ